jgi:hypothetical protein
MDIVSYRDRLLEICTRDGWDAALGFLETIFHAPERQRPKGKPTDFLNRRHEEKVTAAEGFDQLVAGFRPRGTIDQRVEFLVDCLAQDRAEHERILPRR